MHIQVESSPGDFVNYIVAEGKPTTADEASVSIGRQRKVGDRDPMTAWHEQ
jgi:hypothetical protein